MKRIRDMNRRSRTLIVYTGIALGTVAAAFLCVWISQMLFRVRENSLYVREDYLTAVISGTEDIGTPLSLETRLDLYKRCQLEGEARLPLPDELTQKEALDIGTGLWTSMVRAYAPGGSELPSGDDADRLIGLAKTTAVLRDFYNEESNAKLAVWCVQVYALSVENETYCLSLVLDSLTGQPLSATGAFFGNIREDNAASDLEAYVKLLGYDIAVLSNMKSEPTEYGVLVTVPLNERITLKKHCYLETQALYTLTLTNR